VKSSINNFKPFLFITRYKLQIITWTFIFVFVTAIGLLSTNVLITNALAEHQEPNTRYYFINEMTGAYTAFILLPLLIAFIKRYPMRKMNWYKRLPLHLFASMLFGVTHTLLMKFSREAIYALSSMGEYDYGQLGFRLVMEYNKQFMVYWLVYGITVLILYVQENQRRKLQTAKLEEQLTKARLQTLQMQLNPHFLFNTLNLISSTMYENVKTADKMIVNLSDLLRLTLNRPAEQEHPLQQELDLLNLYINIMKARFENNLLIKTEIDPLSLNALVPRFILQPLVENAITHSIENIQRVCVDITSRIHNGILFLAVGDNGPGIPSQGTRNGVGLANTAERLEKLYGPAHPLRFHNRESGGFEVCMEIPVIPTEEK